MRANTREMQELGRRISAAREATGCRQEDLAATIGTTAMSVSRYERGVMEPGATVLARIAVALGVSADRLLGLD
jgi:transcriptional regulator with XRE-family HTH domain